MGDAALAIDIDEARGKKTVKKVKTVKKAKAKTAKKTTTAKTESKEVAITTKKSHVPGMVEAEKARNDARKAYAAFQMSWFDFAKIVAHIHNEELWAALGFENFKEFCVEEFKDVGYQTLVKFVHVVNDWGESIETRLSKDSTYLPPSYETCYTLTASQDKLPKGVSPKLRKKILDGAVTTRDIRTQVAEAKGEPKGVRSDAAEARILKNVEDAKPLSMKLADPKGFDEAAELILSKVDFLIENLPLLGENIGTISPVLDNLATKLQDTLLPEVDDFLNAVADKIEDADEDEELDEEV